jgi:hypothetical protein|tara:strand:+ start:1400 stop:1837 length:438 start_codon:yes stop_codon:yes gene_type:complete
MIKEIIYENKLYALIIKDSYQKKKGISFFTKDNANQQIGFMNHPKNYVIKPHKHQKRETKIFITSEVIILQKGKLRVDFYNTKKKYLFSVIIKKNQVIMLVHGGHGFKVLEPVKMLEIKQGPFVSNKDKVKFDKIDEKKIKIKKI